MDNVTITVRRITEGEHAGKWSASLHGEHVFSLMECVASTPQAVFQTILNGMEKAIKEVHKPCWIEYELDEPKRFIGQVQS